MIYLVLSTYMYFPSIMSWNVCIPIGYLLISAMTFIVFLPLSYEIFFKYTMLSRTGISTYVKKMEHNNPKKRKVH